MAKRLQFKRLIWLAVLLGVAFAGLGYRLVDLQLLRHEDLSLKAQRNTASWSLLEPRRGDILDIRGNVLATSEFVKTVCADPSMLGDHQAEVARALAPVLEVAEAELMQKLTPHRHQTDKGDTVTNRYVVLQRKVSMENWAKIQQTMTNLSFGLDEKKLPKNERKFYQELRQKAVFAEPLNDQLRKYPNQTLAAHVLGCVGTVERDANGAKFSQTVGLDGIELALNSNLVGICGWRMTETDRAKHELVALREQNLPPHDGLNVVLTIDSFIQHIVESALAEGMEKHTPISISGIVIRPRTGEILAMATLPTYDPNHPGNDLEARRNRVITDVVEPGSTFKIVVVSGALNDGVVRLNDVFDCEYGHFHYAGRILHDHDSHGPLTVERIITKSSNIGAAKVGIRMGEARLADYIRNYGFGAKTGLPLPGEMWGIVHPVSKWSKVSIAQIPMGQGISVTRIQMAMAMCAIANNGWLMRPMLVDHLEDRDHNMVWRYPPQPARQVISEAAAKEMVQALKTVVSSEGTAFKAALEHYTVAGKTGTAQKVENGVYVRKYFASFIGFFPADHPELCISVTMDEPKQGYYGGQIAAPIFKQIAERAATYLSIQPEDGADSPPLDTGVSTNDNRAPKPTALKAPLEHAAEPVARGAVANNQAYDHARP